MSVEIREELFEKYSILLEDLDVDGRKALFEDVTFWRIGEEYRPVMDLVLLCESIFRDCKISSYVICPSSVDLGKSDFVLKCGLKMEVYTSPLGITGVSLSISIDANDLNSKLEDILNYMISNCAFLGSAVIWVYHLYED